MGLELEIKKSKMQTEDYIGIVVFSFMIFLTLDFPTSFMTTILFVCGYVLFKYAFEKSNVEYDKFFNYISESFNTLFYTAIILFFMDVIVTGFSVHYFKFVSEGNKYIINYWDRFGYPLGESLRVFLVLFLVFFPLWIAGKSKNKVLNMLSFLSLSAGIVVFTFVVLGNLIIFFKGFC